MKRAAIGVRVHSGWGALVVVCGSSGAQEAIERRRVVIIEPKMPGAAQPFHFAASLSLQQAEEHIAKCAAASKAFAQAAIRDLLRHLQDRSYQVAGAAVLLSSGRELPELPRILASHPLIHTAEGEFFRTAFRNAFESEQIHVTGIRERDLADQSKSVFGAAALKLQQRIAGMGRILGPPWTADQKSAALPAAIVLNLAKKR